MTPDEAREYVVIVNEGSGCIFQPADPDATYVLTAKHNIENAGSQINQLIRFNYENGSLKKIVIEIDKLIDGENYFPHPKKDIAIVKIDRVKGLNRLLKVNNLGKNRNGYALLGYPKKRRDANKNCVDWFRPDEEITISSPQTDGMREAKIPDNPTYEEIVGHSGGGILKIPEEQDFVFIAGILNRIAKADNEQLGFIGITPIHDFDEIIDSYHNGLSALEPHYLENFSFLKSKAFDLKAGRSQKNVSKVKLFLERKAEEVVQSDITPKGIKDFFGERLLVDIDLKEELDCDKIWIMWLEFLTILNLVKDKVHSEEELSEIFNSYRLLFSNSKKEWADEVIDKLLYSDYIGLKKEATVIVGLEESPRDSEYIIEPGNITHDISSAIEAGKEIRIDDGLISPFDEYRFVHINFFKQESIERRHKEYAKLIREEEIMKKLNEVYDEIFKA